jgi:DNA-binding LacI/PurR family transcriptional regulator
MVGRRVTLADVAREAGSSVGTVSRILNGRADLWRIAPATQERVRAAALRLRYVPDPTARALAQGRNRTIGITTPRQAGAGLHVPFFEDFAAAAIEAAGARDHHVLFLPPARDAGPFDPYAALPGAQIDGLILYYLPEPDAAASALFRLGLPVVVAGRGDELIGDDVPAVIADHADGGRRAARYLREAGHRRVGVLAGPAEPTRGEVRFRAFAEELGGIDDDWVVTRGWSPAHGERAMHDLLDRHPDLTAVFAGGDLIAMGALKAARDRRLRVPEDVAVMGFGDFQASPYLTPPLTTIHWPLKEIGVAAVELLLAVMLGEPTEPRHRRLPMPLVVRGSA